MLPAGVTANEIGSVNQLERAAGGRANRRRGPAPAFHVERPLGSLIDVGPAWYSRLTTKGKGAWRWCWRS